MAETDIALCLGQILANIIARSPTGVISLYPSKAIQLPKVLEK
jgi:hypothetical protein